MTSHPKFTDTVSMTRAAAKALLGAAADPKLRRLPLEQIAVYADGSLCATDGTSMLLYTPKDGCETSTHTHVGSIRLSDLKIAIALATAKKSDVVVGVVAPDDDLQFPDIDRVLKFKGVKNAGGPIGVDPLYLARVGKALSAVADRKEAPIALSVRGPLGPISLRMATVAGSWHYVVMPRRM